MTAFKVGLLLALTAAVPTLALAQHQGMPPGMAGTPAETDAEAANTRAKNVEKYDDFTDRAHLAAGKDPAKLRADATAQSAPLLAAMQLPCEIEDAAPVGRGKATLDGKRVPVSIFEVACHGNLGFLLVARGQEPPYATSCFSAAKTHATVVAGGGKSDMYCQLPANADIKTMARAILAGAGTACDASNVDWFGRNLATHTEITEVACSDGKGYLLQTAQAGSTSATSAMSCQQAAAQRIQCRLTDGGPLAKPVTDTTFREFMAQQDPACKVAQLRLIAQESKHDRYLIEVQCPSHPGGLIAMVPLNGNPAPYEAMDCAAAAARGVHCELSAQ